MATSTAPTASGETTLARPEPPPYHSGKTFFWAIALILVVGGLAWLLIGYFGTDSFQDLDQKRVKERQEILLKRNTDDAKLLNDPPSYLDKEKGKIRVPLARAMDLAFKELQNDKPRAAYPLTQSPPQPAAAPTSPDKGAGSPKDGNVNPAASNPTVGQPSPAAAQAPTPVPAGTSAAPATAAPAAKATPAVGTAATGTPAPSPAPSATNNALNPGNPPPSGAQPQPSPAAAGNSETTAGSTPSGVQPQPLNTSTPAPAAGSTPAPDSKEPGTTPGGTP